ncbi:MAG: hypothetical protein SVT52_03550 [Planctomycetota bacterium]|nr:hypothetical protein [Planctomycetota bacterium]
MRTLTRITHAVAVGFAALSAGCQKPVHFPADLSKAAAEASQAAAAYDADHDGKADFFLYAEPTGRVDRIAYDNDGDEKPDVLINLDAIEFGRCRHLVIILDGFGYDLLKEYYDAGGLRMCFPPSRVIAPYPTLTDPCMEDILGYIPCRGFEAACFDRKRNRTIGGKNDYLAGKNEPYNRLLQYRAKMIWDAIGYLYPEAVFGKEINDAKRLFDRRATQEVLAYFVSSAGVGTRSGADGQRGCLRRIERFVNQVLYETRGQTKITLLADHGHSYQPAQRIELEKHLKQAGWRLRDRLDKPQDVVYVRFGLVTYASFATRRSRKLAEDLISCEGVELASYADADRVVVLGRNGGRAIITRSGRGYSYQPTSGDPLELRRILATLQHDESGAIDADALLKATAKHKYPAPLQRLWRAHFALVENCPDVIISLEDRFYSGLKSFAGSVSIASTHGGLNYRNSVTFIMTTAGPLPEVMRSADISKSMKQLTGENFPMRK